MEWSDTAIILGTRRHGETSAIVELFTREHGRHLGLVRGGRSRRMQPVLQAGNGVDVVWRQVGQGLVVLGLSMLAAETEVRFTLDGEAGRCSFSPDKESCRVG